MNGGEDAFAYSELVDVFSRLYRKEYPPIMSILTLLAALLLSGASSFTVHTNSVYGGGPISGPQAGAAPSTPPTVDSISSGGPIT